MCRWNCGHSEENPFCWTGCDVVSDLFELQTSEPCHNSGKLVYFKRNTYDDDEICWTCTDNLEERITPESLTETLSGEEADDELEEGEISEESNDELEEGEISESSEPEAEPVAEVYLEQEDIEMVDSIETIMSLKDCINPEPKWPRRSARSYARSTRDYEPYNRVRKAGNCFNSRKNKYLARRNIALAPKPRYRNKTWRAESTAVEAARYPERRNGEGMVVDRALLCANYGL